MAVAVMAHPDREKMAKRLAKDFDAWVTWDRMGSRWDTGRRAWLSLKDTPEPWAMVLQDDAVPAPGLRQAIPKILRHVPDDSPVVLYAGRTRAWEAQFRRIPRGVSFLVMDWIWWGPGIILPTHLIEAVVAHGDTLDSDQYDHMLGMFFHANRIPVYYTWPSVVDHARAPSLVEGRMGNRRAYRMVRNAAQQRWTARTLEVSPPG